MSLNYLQLIIDEFAIPPTDVLVVNSHWGRFSGSSPVEKQYLLTKRAVARFLLSRARNKVDTQIGFDQIKASQIASNLEKVLLNVNEELKEQFPEVFEDAVLISLSSELGLLIEDD